MGDEETPFMRQYTRCSTFHLFSAQALIAKAEESQTCQASSAFQTETP